MYDTFLHQENWAPLAERFRMVKGAAEELPDCAATLIARKDTDVGCLRRAVFALSETELIRPDSTVFAHATEIYGRGESPAYRFVRGDLVRVAKDDKKVPVITFAQLVDYFCESQDTYDGDLRFHRNHSRNGIFFEPSRLRVGDGLYAVDEIAIDTGTLYIAASERPIDANGSKNFRYGIQCPDNTRDAVSAITVVRTTTNPNYRTEAQTLVS